MNKTLLYLSVFLIPAFCMGQTDTFNYKKALTIRRSLSATVNTINRSSGEVEFLGGDSRGATTPGLTFTWIWGDDTSTTGFFPQKKTYADVNKNYLAKVIANYSAMEKDTVEVLVDFVKGKLSPIVLDPKLKVFIPRQPITFDNSYGNFQKVILPPFSDKFFTDVSRSDFEYLMHLGAIIEFDFLNKDTFLYQGKFEQYMFRDSSAGGAYSLWFTRPVSFGSGDGFLKGTDSDFSSLYHEMGHNMTLNFPANFIFGGKIDGNANAIYSETMAQIFQYSVGYEIINNYKTYGLDEVFLSKFKTNFFNGIVNLRKNFDDYVKAGMPFTTWNIPSTPHDETLLTFLTTAYKFYEQAELQNNGYRVPIKRLTQFLNRFNAEWQRRYDQNNNTPEANAFRATMMVAAMSHAFQKDLRADFRALNFSISDADWAFLNPQILDVPIRELSVSASHTSASLDVISNISWSAMSSQPWLSVSPAAGSGNLTVTLNASANASVTARKATITFAANGVETRLATLTQAGATAFTSASASALNLFFAEGSSAAFDIASNTAWTVTTSQPWLTVAPASGTDNAKVTITVSLNPLTDIRRAVVTVRADGVADKTVDVSQAASPITGAPVQTGRGVEVFPNPAYDWVQLRGLPIPSLILLYDLRGMVVREVTSHLPETMVNIQDLPVGLYIILLNQEVYPSFFKMIKEK
jgi:hypothetical protein